jgi:hypothetical protein
VAVKERVCVCLCLCVCMLPEVGVCMCVCVRVCVCVRTRACCRRLVWRKVGQSSVSLECNEEKKGEILNYLFNYCQVHCVHTHLV